MTTTRREMLVSGACATAAMLTACAAPRQLAHGSAQHAANGAAERLPGRPICATCGTQFDEQPAVCPICTDERQYVSLHGQQWTSLRSLDAGSYRNELTQEEKNLWSLHTQPEFAIGQRAFLLNTAKGNVLWDCLSLLDAATIQQVRALGGLSAIAVSHPHFYASMYEWSEAFGGIPIYVHAHDERWLPRKQGNIQLWKGDEYALLGELRLIHLGGHFDGSQVLLWPAGAQNGGVLLAGDEPFVTKDRKWVSFMRSFPNYLPLAPAQVARIGEQLQRYSFQRIYGAFVGQRIDRDGGELVKRSVARYLRATQSEEHSKT